MQRARRLYLYFVAAVSLLAVGIGASRLLMNLFQRLSDVLFDTTLISGDAEGLRREASLAIAIIVVALPIWMLHWWLAERATSGDDAQAGAERSSTERALYLSVVLLVSFIILLTSSTSFVRELIHELAGDDASIAPAAIPNSLAMLLTAAGIWLYHGHVRRSDVQRGAGLARTATLPRFYLYTALVVAAVVTLTNLSNLLGVAAQVALDEPSPIVGQRWWVSALAGSVAGSLVGLALWGVHMNLTSRLTMRVDAIGDLERHSVLRRFALYTLTFIGLVASLFFVAGSLEQALRELLGAAHTQEQFVFRVVEPLLRAIPFAGAWFLFGRLVVDEADASGEAEDQATIRRIYSYGIALIGLAFGSFGLAGILATLLDRVAGVGPVLIGSGPWKNDISNMLPIALLGSAAWLWQSHQFGQWVEDDPGVERPNIVRRVYVYAALAGAVIAVLVSLAVIIYRILTAILNVGTEALGRALSTPVAVFVVSAAVLTYHALILRADVAAGATDNVPLTRVFLELDAPADATIADVLEQLERGLPDGYQLRVVSSTKLNE